MEKEIKDLPPLAAETTQKPVAPPVTAPAAPPQVPSHTHPPVKGFRNRMKTAWSIVKETWDEHDFWVEALAVKGGASAIVIAGIAGITYVATLPLLLMAGGIAGCGALIGVGIYGIAAGGTKAWDSLRTAYARAMGREPPVRKKSEKPNMLERLKETKAVKKLLEHRLARKFFDSRAWKMTEKFTKKREQGFLHSMAVGGALVTLALGVSVLATQILVLPVIAVSSIFTFAAVEVVTCFASGIYGLYLSGRSIVEKRREKKAARLAAKAKGRAGPEDDDETPEEALAAPVPGDAPVLKTEKPLTPEFVAATTAAANDDKKAVAAPTAGKPAGPAV